MKLKVCGMRDNNNIIDVSELNPDYMGFIFYNKSKRFVTGDIPIISNKIEKIAVFVNETIEKVKDILCKYDINTVQLHGNEDVKFCADLKKNNFKIIKAFSIDENFDFECLKEFDKSCDYYLFDTKGSYPGGNGYKFNWQILKNYKLIKPYFLSGGIGIGDTNDIIEFRKTKAGKFCFAIDVNSMYEIEPGIKNVKKIKNLISNLK